MERIKKAKGENVLLLLWRSLINSLYPQWTIYLGMVFLLKQFVQYVELQMEL